MNTDWDALCAHWHREVDEMRSEISFTDARGHAIHSTGTLYDRELHQTIAARGWIGMAWSENSEFASDPLRAAHTCALWEAYNYFMLPVDFLELTEMAAYAVSRSAPGPAQRRFLDDACSGNALASLGFSEPDAGSDVAAARTTARRDGDEWIIDGAKIFTTGGHVADFVFLLARTNTTGRKHDGLTMFLVPLSSSGIEVQPIFTLGGERTNAVFFNEVRVPVDAVVGDLNRGWSTLMVGLAFERSMMGSYLGRAQRLLDDLLAVLGRRGPASQTILNELSMINARIDAARACVEDVARLIVDGQQFTNEAATTKLLATEVFKDLSYLAIDFIGPEALVEGSAGTLGDDGRLEHWFRGSQVSTIYGGSNEVQRNILSRYRLDLPTG